MFLITFLVFTGVRKQCEVKKAIEEFDKRTSGHLLDRCRAYAQSAQRRVCSVCKLEKNVAEFDKKKATTASPPHHQYSQQINTPHTSFTCSATKECGF